MTDLTRARLRRGDLDQMEAIGLAGMDGDAGLQGGGRSGSGCGHGLSSHGSRGLTAKLSVAARQALVRNAVATVSCAVGRGRDAGDHTGLSLMRG